MRNALYMFRHNLKLTQGKMADEIGCNRATYSAIENGMRDGTMYFWNNFQKAFGVADADMWGLMKVDK